MKAADYPCDLCGQPVKVTGFKLDSTSGPKKFCCAGCLSIFQLLNPEPVLSENKKLEKVS